MHSFLDIHEIINIFQGFNPWWSNNRQPAAPPSFKRLAYNACRQFLLDKSINRAILLSGPRRVGKTIILNQIAYSLIDAAYPPGSIFYISLDHPLLKLLSLREILEIYHTNFQVKGSPTFLLLDEIQYSKDWETEIKLLIDHQPFYRILATGSASVSHKHKLAESGVGRWLTVQIPTLSFYEFLHIRGEAIPDIDTQLKLNDLFKKQPSELNNIAQQLNSILPLFQRYLLVGGFPETARQENIAFCQRLLREDVVEKVLKRDMTALFGVRNINELEKLFIYLCLHTGSILAQKTCADALGTSTVTIANHLNLLEQANLIYRVPPGNIHGKQILKARNKYYLVDAALRNAILLRGEEILSRPDEMGTIVETTVLRHLFAYYYRDTPKISYWRDPVSQKEVDIIVSSPAYVYPFEVKYSEQPKLGKNTGLVQYCRIERPKSAFWVTKNDRDFGITQLDNLDTQFLKIPAYILCYLLGQAERLLWETPPDL